MQLQTVNLENPDHIAMLQRIHEQTLLTTGKSDYTAYDYRKLGFTQNYPDVVNEFLNAGVLGLHFLSQIASANHEEFVSVSIHMKAVARR